MRQHIKSLRVELDPSAKIEVTYYDKNKKKRKTKSFPITEKGFVVPDLSEHIKNPGFNNYKGYYRKEIKQNSCLL